MNPRVKKILSIEPYTMDVLWSDDKVRAMNFENFLSDYFTKENSLYFKILNQEIFVQAKTDGRTIYWENIASMLDENGKSIPAPLDFCPNVLFRQSYLKEETI